MTPNELICALQLIVGHFQVTYQNLKEPNLHFVIFKTVQMFLNRHCTASNFKKVQTSM